MGGAKVKLSSENLMTNEDDGSEDAARPAPPQAGVPALLRLLMMGAFAYYGMNYYNNKNQASASSGASTNGDAAYYGRGDSEFDEFGEDEFGLGTENAGAPAESNMRAATQESGASTSTGYEILDRHVEELRPRFSGSDSCTVKVVICTQTTGFVDRYKEMVEAVADNFDDSRVTFTGEKFPPPAQYRLLTMVLNVLWMVGLAFSLLGERLLNMLGLQAVLGQQTVDMLVSNKLYIVGGIFLINLASNFLDKTGAFEITIDDLPLHSTLATEGRLLTARELIRALKMLGFAPLAGGVAPAALGSAGADAAAPGTGFDDEFDEFA